MPCGSSSVKCRAIYWVRFASGESDSWFLLHSGDRLVAILEVNPEKRRVAEAKGPSNLAISLRDAQGVALFCQAADLEIGEDVKGLLPDYAAPLLAEPRVVELEGRVALYAEWPTAVRVDLSVERDCFFVDDPANMLVLSFDSNRSVTTPILVQHRLLALAT